MDIRIIEESASQTSAKKVVGTQVPHELYMRLKQQADSDFMSVSDLLRKIIFNYFKEDGKDEIR